MWLNLDLLPCTVTGSWIDLDLRLTGSRVPGYTKGSWNLPSILSAKRLPYSKLTHTVNHSESIPHSKSSHAENWSMHQIWRVGIFLHLTLMGLFVTTITTLPQFSFSSLQNFFSLNIQTRQ